MDKTFDIEIARLSQLEEASMLNKVTDKETKASILLKQIFSIVIPTICIFLSIFIQQLIVLAFIGNKFQNTKMIDAMGLSHLYVNCFLFVFAMGFIFTFEIFGSNSYGKKNFYQLGVYFHRAQLISMTVAIVLSLIHYFLAPLILILLNIDADIITYFESYMRTYLLYIFPEIIFVTCSRFLNVISGRPVSVIILVVTLILHPLWCYIFIYYFDLGILGASMSILCTQSLNAISIVSYLLVVKPCPNAIFFYNADSFKEWWEYTKLSIPSCLQLSSIIWGYEVHAIIAIDTGINNYSSHLAMTSISVIVYSIGAGFSSAATILTSMYLGKGYIKTVKNLLRICTIACATIICSICLIMILLKPYLIRLFIQDPVVNEMTENVFYLLCIDIFMCNITKMNSGFFRGFSPNLQYYSTLLFFLDYAIQIFFSFTLAIIYGYGVKGIWIAINLGDFVVFCIYYFALIVLIDVQKIYKDSHYEKKSKMLLNEENKLN